jgi:N-methylhydantoinase A
VNFQGYPIKGRQVDIHTVGAGGGSIAQAESAGILRVGPRSAAAHPGPACYGLGGSAATVTDANMVLGRLGARTLGQSIVPDRELAVAAVTRLASELGVDGATRMAEGIVAIAVAQMASAIREITVERGHDPADFTLLAFGGAGPMHATQVARELGIRRVLIPVFPGNLSALGLLASDQVHEEVCTFLHRLQALDPPLLHQCFAELEDRGRDTLARRGFPSTAIRFRHALDMRYARQAFEITVDLPAARPDRAALQRFFLDSYQRHYGHSDPDGEIEIVNVRTSIIGVTRKPQPRPLPTGAFTLADAIVARRNMVVDGNTVSVPVYDRDRLPADACFDGPALVEEAGATTVTTPGWRTRVDEFGHLRLTATA